MGQQERREGTNGNGVGTTEKRDASGRIDRYAEPRTRPQQMRGLAWILIFFGAMAFIAASMQLVRSSDTLYLKGVAIGAVLAIAGLLWMRLAERRFRRELGDEVEAMIDEVATIHHRRLDADTLARDTWLDLGQASDELDRLVSLDRISREEVDGRRIYLF